ncbi:MAG TPA: PAS domain S-box protein [Bacteroidales bacterium]|nr:PAS domain S-box protein [Bacteroidales bacterium]
MTAQDIKKEIQNYDNLSKRKGEKTKQIVYLFNENDSFDAILERIKKLSKNSVIYVVLYERDSENKYYSPQSVVKQLLEVTDLPIFCSFDIYMNEGVIGGRVAGGLRVGEYLGWGIVNFFENKETHVCESTGEGQLEWAFSYPALKKYDISFSSLPENSTLYFESSSDLWGNKYLSMMLLILVVLALGTAIIFYIFNLQSSKKVKKQVKDIADLFDRLEYLRASMPIGFIELDSELKITYWNESAERIFGYSAKEALGVNLFDLTVSAENREYVDAVVQELFQTSKRFVHSQYIQHKTDTSLECEWYFTHKVYSDTDKFYIMCMIINITERESMKREQENLINALKKMMLNQDSFIATSMHDIKNIMAPISAYSEMLLLQDLPKEKSKDLAEKIYKNITFLSDTFVELMNVSKVKGEIIKASPAEFNIRNLSETVSAMLEDHYKRKEINFIDNLPNQLVYADYEMIYSVLINLYGNAIKFTYDKGKVEVSGKVINDKDFEIRIKDNGVGIDIKKFNLMLSENKYFTTKGTAGEEGTGLGLLLCKELIANNHGEFRAENNEDGGSSFYFTLPIKREKN